MDPEEKLSPSDRLFKLVQLLSESFSGLTLSAIQKHLGYENERQVQRLIKQLRDKEIPIEEFDDPDSEEKRFRLKATTFSKALQDTQGLFIHPVGLTAREATYLQLALSRRSVFSKFFPAPEWNSLTHKIRAITRVHAPKTSSETPDDVLIERPTGSRGPLPGVVETLTKAIAGRYRVSIQYTNARGESSTGRLVDPVRLVQHLGTLYLLSFDQALESGIRVWAVHRIGYASPKPDKPFTLPGSLKLEELFRDAIGIVFEEPAIEVELEFSPSIARFIHEQSWPDSVSLRFVGDEKQPGLLLQGVLKGRQELIGRILSWGPDVLVRSPQDLASEVLAKVEATAKLYKEGGPAWKKNEK